MNQSLGKLIQDAIKEGKLSSTITPFELKKFFNENKNVEVATKEVIEDVVNEDEMEEPEEITVDEFELLIDVTGANKYSIEVKQDGEVIEDPEGDGYAVSNGSEIEIKAVNGKKVLSYTYKVDSNRSLLFDFKSKEVIEKDDRV